MPEQLFAITVPAPARVVCVYLIYWLTYRVHFAANVRLSQMMQCHQHLVATCINCVLPMFELLPTSDKHHLLKFAAAQVATPHQRGAQSLNYARDGIAMSVPVEQAADWNASTGAHRCGCWQRLLLTGCSCKGPPSSSLRDVQQICGVL